MLSSAVHIALFCGVLFGLSLFFLLKPANAVSVSERRLLETFPDFSVSAVLSGKFFQSFDRYVSDQFPMREEFRSLKARVRFDLLRRTENNGIYLLGDSAVKRETNYSAAILRKNLEGWNAIVRRYFPNARVFYSVVPDKNYFGEGPKYDYAALLRQVREGAPEGAVDMPIFSCGPRRDLLTLEDYYTTDLHWRQEKIAPVAEYYAKGLGVEIDPFDAYAIEDCTPFYGAYCGQSALPLPSDMLRVARSAVLSEADCYVYRAGDGFEKELRDIYDLSMLSDVDKYSVFLSGPQAVVEIQNPMKKEGKTLVVFRDSFASSLVPFLVSGYRKIVLIDIRYVHSDMISLLDFGEADDVFFLYAAVSLSSVPMR